MAISTSASPQRLLRTLSAWETYGFGLTGWTGWIGLFAAMHYALGDSAIWVLIPATLVGVLIDYQVKQLGFNRLDIAGGTPNYMTDLLKDYPILASYAAIGYLFNWAISISLSAVVLTEIIQVNLEAVGLSFSTIFLKISLTLLPFIVAFRGTRALSILNLFLVIAATGSMIIFILQGLGWLILSPSSPSIASLSWTPLSFSDWAKWFLFASFVTYSSETASSFVADSCQPIKTLKFLNIASWGQAVILLASSWIVTQAVGQLAVNPSLKDNTYLELIEASKGFWGGAAPIMATFFLASAALLLQATAVSNCSRILYQLAHDRHVAPVFGVVSPRGVFGPALVLLMAISLLCLIWGNINQIVFIGSVGWFVAYTLFHLSLWLGRKRVDVLFPRLSLGLFLVEVVILWVGGIAWGWSDFLLGLAFPLGIMAVNGLVQRLPFAPFRPSWWLQLYQPRPQPVSKDSLMFQVSTLILLLAGSVLIGWGSRALLDHDSIGRGNNLIVILLLMVVLVGVAIASWTSLPQIAAIAEAEVQMRSQAQKLEQSLQELKSAQLQLVQGEKMSSLGQLVAGIAHEINNPINFIYGNIPPTTEYVQDLLYLIELYQKYYPEPVEEISDQMEAMDLEFLQEDLLKILASMRIGADRVAKIVLSLRNFSRMDESDLKTTDIHEGIDSTLLILQHRLKARPDHPEVKVIKNYGNLPLVECFAGQLNQVFMNILSNAIDAIDTHNKVRSYQEILGNPSVLTISTEITGTAPHQQIIIRIADNGTGISDTVREHIFEPFYTTKPAGQGTGLGLSISYRIIAEKHGGTIQCLSQPGQGTEFIIQIPKSISGTSHPQA